MTRLKAGARHPVRFTLNGKAVEAKPSRACCCPISCASRSVRPELTSAASTASAAPARSSSTTCSRAPVSRSRCRSMVAISGRSKGLAPSPDRLSVLQRAFRRNHALQCGFCTAGILMSLDHYLSRHPAPTEEDIRELLSGHLCRCTGYTPIIRAALEVAPSLLHPAKRLQMLDLGSSFVASAARDPDAVALVDGDLRLTYRQWYADDLCPGCVVRPTRPEAGRSRRHRAAEPLGGGDAALGLPVRRARHHAGQLARQGRRARFLHRELRSLRDRLRGRLARRPCRNRRGLASCDVFRSIREQVVMRSGLPS